MWPNENDIIPSALMLDWYRHGDFPMFDETTGKTFLYNPDPRTILPLNDFHIPKSLGKKVRSGKYILSIDTAFELVIRSCANRKETWLSESLIRSYIALHHISKAHSLEIWINGELAGGLYGVTIGGAFFGESMFHVHTDASKIALVLLVQRMKEKGMLLLDVQYMTPHLERFGAIQITRSDYLLRLDEAVLCNVSFN